MKRFMLMIAAVAAVGVTATAWSQGAQSGGAGAGAAGTGEAGAGAAGAGAATNAGAGPAGAGAATNAGAGPAGAGAASNAGAGRAGAGAAGNTGAAGAAGASSVAGSPATSGATGSPGAPGTAGAPGNGGAAGVPQNSSVNGNSGAGDAVGGAANGVGVGATGQQRSAAGLSNSGVTGQSRQGNDFNGVNQRPLFSDPGARQQLGLNDSQFSNLNRSYQEAYGRYNQGVEALDSSLTAEQRQERMQQLQGTFNNEFNRSLGSAITNPEMRTRYSQLDRQYQGFNAFNDQAVQRQLNLTPQQTLQVQRMAADWHNQMQQVTRGGGTDANGQQLNQQQWTAMQSQYSDKLNSVLTPEQQRTWSQLTGQRYNFPSSAYSQSIGNSQQRTDPNSANGIQNATFGTNGQQGAPAGGLTGNGRQAVPQGVGQGAPSAAQDAVQGAAQSSAAVGAGSSGEATR